MLGSIKRWCLFCWCGEEPPPSSFEEVPLHRHEPEPDRRKFILKDIIVSKELSDGANALLNRLQQDGPQAGDSKAVVNLCFNPKRNAFYLAENNGLPLLDEQDHVLQIFECNRGQFMINLVHTLFDNKIKLEEKRLFIECGKGEAALTCNSVTQLINQQFT
jgi:hypothetical protein